MAIRKGETIDANTPKAKEILKDVKGYSADQASKIDKKKQYIREFRQEASRLAAIANKRIQRLEKNDFTNTPAYQTYIKEGGKKFGVKGKSFNEVQAEMSKLKGFLEAKTSTIKGANQVLKDIAANTGVKYKNLKELKQKSEKFFVLASKIEQYLRSVHDAASAIGYQKIWESINVQVQTGKLDLADGEANVDKMIKTVSDALVEYETPAPIIGDFAWYSVKKDNI